MNRRTIACVAVLCAGLLSSTANAQRVVSVTCQAVNQHCVEIFEPDPVHIPIGGQVIWTVGQSCRDVVPCSGVCIILVAPGPGFPGFEDMVEAGQRSRPTPPFEEPGIFPYRIECSVTLGIIIVEDPTGPLLMVQGQCPTFPGGPLTVGWTSATPNTTMGLVFAFNTGAFIVLSGPCIGTQLGLGTNQLQLVTTLNSGPTGSGSVSGQAGQAACGKYLQLVVADGSPCSTSNVVQIPP